jgi:hypothetical protein
MTRNILSEFTKTLTAVTALFAAALALPSPSFAASAAASAPELSHDDADWSVPLDNALDTLYSVLMMVRGTPDREAMVEAICLLYDTQGVSPGADLAAGRSATRTAYSTLLAHPEALNSELYVRFMADLPLMYSDMGGDPLDLLKLSR